MSIKIVKLPVIKIKRSYCEKTISIQPILRYFEDVKKTNEEATKKSHLTLTTSMGDLTRMTNQY